MAYAIKPKQIRRICELHDSYWDNHVNTLFQYKCAYETDFWENQYKDNQSQIQVQTSDAYGYIESYIASLFSRNPGVIVKGGVRGRGNPRAAQHLANDFLILHRQEIEDASRLALIYPMAFMKMSPREHKDIYRRVDMMACNPWDVILDRDAKRYKDQRFIAHKYYLSLPEAQAKFGNRQYTPTSKKEYFERLENNEDVADLDADDMFKYIEVIEFYDLINMELKFWSPQYTNGDRFLEADSIPFMDHNGEPCIPIVPLYFNRKPDCPIEGYSAMKRIYDQIFETNLIRTFQANGVRKASRQYIIKRGTFDEDSMAQITSGVDGLFVEIDDDDLAGAIRPVPNNPVPPELQAYYAQVQADKDKGSIMAPFTRGESTRASATEIAALAAYTSSEVGRLARERDSMIEELARVYLCILSLYLERDKADIVIIDNKAEPVGSDDLHENWVIFAQDQAQTPLSESVRKREFISSIPTLQSLGVPPDTLLAEMVRALGLPESFVEEAARNREDMAKAQQAVSAAKAGTVTDNIQPDATELQQLSQPVGPNNLNAILGEQP